MNEYLSKFFNFDQLSLIMAGLVIYIGICVASFASRYMKGDNKYNLFFAELIILITSVIIFTSTDNLLILLLFYSLSNFTLVLLMIHKSDWRAARASGVLAAKNYLFSIILLSAAFAIFYINTGTLSIKSINTTEIKSPDLIVALLLIIISSMQQSAIWPFHKWLLSSLNSPTPVSAIMHAGLINGGGFLLIRFAPLYSQSPMVLNLIFIMGLVTAVLGTLWKLMQSDVKRMLACSTMGQMGFMFMQCGMGLFPAAIAHLVWHGMFKSYLFLASGGAAQEKRFDLFYPPKLHNFIFSLICGMAAGIGFAYTNGRPFSLDDTSLILTLIASLAASQFALPILRASNFKSFITATFITLTAGLLYGASVHLITHIVEPMGIMDPQPINLLHIIAITIILLSWLYSIFGNNKTSNKHYSNLELKTYVMALNASQPNPSTVTAHRNHYKY